MKTIFIEVPTKFRPLKGFEIREGFEANDFELMEAPALLPNGSTSARELEGLSVFVLYGHSVRVGY